jgi:hypothetical protein
VRAYALIEVDPGAADVVSRLRSFSLRNCKIIAERLYPSEVIAHFEATELSDFNAALAELLSGVSGVLRITVLGLMSER